MPVNRNALIRYKTIDQCLQNRFRKWTLEDLIDACSDALYEYEGIDKGVSKRTVQGDLQMMRSDKLGYNAPIIVQDKKYYSYEDPNYSITNIPLSKQDLDQLGESIALLKQFRGFSHFRSLEGMVQKLEDHVLVQKTQRPPIIDVEKNNELTGLEYLDPLYQAILKENSLLIHYQSFRAREEKDFVFYPYLLKEFRNRWFLIGSRSDQPDHLMNLALDRIKGIEISEQAYVKHPNFDPQTHFEHTIGVSVSPGAAVEEVRLLVNHVHAPYVLTKPLHRSQEVLDRSYYGIEIRLRVQLNYELERLILGFAEGIEVLAPRKLQRRILERTSASVENYNSQLTERGLSSIALKLKHEGLAQLHRLYTQREIKRLLQQIKPYSSKGINQQHLLLTAPQLLPMLFNRNVHRLLKRLEQRFVLLKASLFHSTAITTYHQQWHQTCWLHQGGLENGYWQVCSPELLPHLYCLDLYLEEQAPVFPLLMKASHRKIFSLEEQQLLTKHSLAYHPTLYQGSSLLYRPSLLRQVKNTTNKLSHKGVVQLILAPVELVKAEHWTEYVVIKSE